MRNCKLKSLVVLAALLWAGSVASQSQGAGDIGTFVQQRYSEGVPFIAPPERASARRYRRGPAHQPGDRRKGPGEIPTWIAALKTNGFPGPDRLFACVNLARHLGIDAEQALRTANRRFETRFTRVEAGLRDDGKVPGPEVRVEMERLWAPAKIEEQDGCAS